MSLDPLAHFLSAEDRDLRNLSDEAFDRLAALAFQAAQATNDQDEHTYSFGCLAVEPGYEHLLPRIRSGTL